MPIYFMWQSSHDPSIDNLILNLMCVKLSKHAHLFPLAILHGKIFFLDPLFWQSSIARDDKSIAIIILWQISEAL